MAENKRTYTCFCCAVKFDAYPEYKAHILEKHEEGRDFVKCPITYCGAPVRSIPAHFKVFHPKIKPPKKGQQSAIVWKDVVSDGGKKKMKTRRVQSRKGWYTSTKMKRDIYYRSGYEERVYQMLDEDADVLSYAAEPFQVPYLHNGEIHQYIVDLTVRFADGHIEVWEIKPSSQSNLPVNKAKWHAAEQACMLRGWKFEVVTEMVMDKLKSKIRRQQNLLE